MVLLFFLDIDLKYTCRQREGYVKLLINYETYHEKQEGLFGYNKGSC